MDYTYCSYSIDGRSGSLQCILGLFQCEPIKDLEGRQVRRRTLLHARGVANYGIKLITVPLYHAMFQVFWGSQVVCPYSATQHGSLQGYCTMAFAVKSLGNGDVNLVTIMLTGQTSFVTTLAWSLPISGDKLHCEAMVE